MLNASTVATFFAGVAGKYVCIVSRIIHTQSQKFSFNTSVYGDRRRNNDWKSCSDVVVYVTSPQHWLSCYKSIGSCLASGSFVSLRQDLFRYIDGHHSLS